MKPEQQQYLQALVIFHCVVAGMLAVLACFPFLLLANPEVKAAFTQPVPPT